MMSATGPDSVSCISNPRTARGRYCQGIGLAPVGFGPLQGDCQGAALRTREAAVRSLGKLADQFGEPAKGTPGRTGSE